MYRPWKLMKLILSGVLTVCVVHVFLLGIRHKAGSLVTWSKTRFLSENPRDLPTSIQMLTYPVGSRTGRVFITGYRRSPKAFLTIGIPSVRRGSDTTYLFQTISSILHNTTPKDRSEVTVVVFLADFDYNYNHRTLRAITERYRPHLTSGFLQVMDVSPGLYPSLQGLQSKFGDSGDRVVWRSKQVVDSALLCLYVKNLSEYYLHLEDDVICAKDFVRHIKDFIKTQVFRDWRVLDFSSLGFIGKLMRSEDLEKFATFALNFYTEAPIDWLLPVFRRALGQSQTLLRTPTLFQHIGERSSLVDRNVTKISTAVDHLYQGSVFEELLAQGKNPNDLTDRINPRAHLVSKIKAKEGFDLHNAYSGDRRFYFISDSYVNKGDEIYIVFQEGQRLKKVFIETGNRSDIGQSGQYKLESGRVEVSPTLMYADTTRDTVKCAKFVKIAAFVNGKVDEIVHRHSERTECLRVVVVEDHHHPIMITRIVLWSQVIH